MKPFFLLVLCSSIQLFTQAEAVTTSYDKLPGVKKGGNITDVVSITPMTMNPMLTNEATDQELASLMYMPLYDVDKENYNFFPALASDLTVSKDKKDYTYTLNPKAKWADGTAVTTDDAEFSWNKLQDPKTNAAPIRGYFSDASFAKVDGQKFRFHIEKPKFNTLETFNTLFYIVQKKQFAGEADFNKSLANLHPVGTGPYQVKSFSRDQAVVFERVTDWWAKDLPQYKARYNQDTLTFKIIPDMALKYEKFLKGEIDLDAFTSEQFTQQVFKSDGDKIGKSRTDGKPVWGAKFETSLPMGWQGIALNLKSPLFAGKSTRQGLAYLVDYQALIDRAYFGMIGQSLSPFGKGTENTDAGLRAGKGVYHYDPKKAAELFKKDGWLKEDGPFLVKSMNGQKTPFHFTVKYYGANPASSKMAVILKEVFKKNGVDIDLRPMDGTALSNDMEHSEFDAMFTGWTGGSIYPDPKQLWSSESIGEGSNKVSFKNAEVDALIAKANLEFDRKKRAKILQQINRILYDEVPYIFLLERNFIMEGLNSKFKSPKWMEHYGSSLSTELFYE